MKNVNVLLICCLFLLIVSCSAVPQKKLSRGQWMELTTRHYESAGVDQVLTAVENLFNLADATDVTFYHAPAAITAVRHSAPFPIHIWYTWQINITKAAQGVDVTVHIPFTGPGLAMDVDKISRQSSDVYNLFFLRLDYLLGTSHTWVSCRDYEKAHPDHTTLEALCLLADDKRPEVEVF